MDVAGLTMNSYGSFKAAASARSLRLVAPKTYFLRCSCSFRNSSVLLLLTPEPLLYDLNRQK